MSFVIEYYPCLGLKQEEEQNKNNGNFVTQNTEMFNALFKERQGNGIELVDWTKYF